MSILARISRPLAAAVTAVLPLAWAAPASADTAGPVVCDYWFFAWSGGFLANLTITNNGPVIDGWTARWTFRSATGNLAAWQAKMTQPDAFAVTATNMSYNAVIGTGRSTQFGWTATAASTEVPTDVTVNGMPC